MVKLAGADAVARAIELHKESASMGSVEELANKSKLDPLSSQTKSNTFAGVTSGRDGRIKSGHNVSV